MARQDLIFGDVPVDSSEGLVLAHSVRSGGLSWAKGRRISRADIAAGRAAGLSMLTGARLEPGDVDENETATRLAAKLCGKNLTIKGPTHGRVNIVATQSGVVTFAAEMIDRLNAVDEAFGIGTLPPFTRVRHGDIVATCKVIPYAVNEAKLLAAEACARRIDLQAFVHKRVALIQTRLPGTLDKVLDSTRSVTERRIMALGGALTSVQTCNHDRAAICDAVQALAPSAHIVLIAGATATCDRADVIPSGIVAAGGTIVRLGMPVDPGNLLCLATVGTLPVVILPGCARSPKRNGFDWVLERLFADIPVDGAAIAAMGSVGLLAEVDRPEPRLASRLTVPKVGAIVLAAGRSLRMGSNKLLADLHGKPVVRHVLEAISNAGLPQPIVVVGDTADTIEAALADLNHARVVATEHRAGMSQSLRAGILSVPDDWDAALVCLGDMPAIKPATLARLTAALTDRHSIVVPTWRGKRGNPVAWGRTHFERLASLSGDIGGKALMAELAEQIIEVAVDDDGILTDVDTPEALEALRNQTSDGKSSGSILPPD